MNKPKYPLPRCRNLLVILSLVMLCGFAPPRLFAHQQPTTVVLLDVNSEQVAMELQMPLSELELAFGNDVTQNTDTLVERLRPQLSDYLLRHIHPATANQPWAVEVSDMKVENAEQTQSGPYQEITIHLNLTPPAGVGTRQFTLAYDVIMHQVVTHKALVGIRKDWEAGKIGEQPVTVGLIMTDTATSEIHPLEVNLADGSWWKGFRGMVGLGIRHIREGTDHLLFLLVLLLPATLLVNGNRWGEFGGIKYSFARLLKIVTAFTVGHSLTLLIGALDLVKIPPQPVEVLIAVSILLAAVHAVRPIFSGREKYVAAGFGLIHGLALATVLADLNLNAAPLALSILGFNIGIELMQVFIIALIVPWLILLSQTRFYKWFRIAGAAGAGVAAAAWSAERVSGIPNTVGSSLQTASEHAYLGVLALALLALAAFAFRQFQNKNQFVETQR